MRSSTSVDKNEITGIFVDGIGAAALNKVNNLVTKRVTEAFLLACATARGILFFVSLSAPVSKRATSIAKRSMFAISTSTTIIKIKTTGASGEGRNS